ncbi:MAG: hypothetical protein ACR9NN_23020 [Nostochopsis sp.]
MSTGKGNKRVKSIPVLHEEVKKQHSIMLTDVVWDKLKVMAQEKGLSISEFVEQWIRGTPG